MMNILKHSESNNRQEPYVHQPFPSVRYHRSGKTCDVKTQEEHDELMQDADWQETPAAFLPGAEARAKAEPKKSGKKADKADSEKGE
jgi:hypothetical protein